MNATPSTLPVQPEGIAAELQTVPQFVGWRWTWNAKKADWDKPPKDAKTGLAASSTDPATWAPFPVALAAIPRYRFSGIGFVVTADLGIVGADLDHCRDPQTGAVDAWAQAIIDQWQSYTTASATGTGVRIFGYGTIPDDGKKRGQIEIYKHRRYLTLTGHRVPGTPLELTDVQEAALALWRMAGGDDQPRRTAPTPAGMVVSCGAITDDAVIALARRGAGASAFAALYDYGDLSAYGGDDSRADLALCCRLAFYCGRDVGQIDRLFRCSKLMRTKWDSPRGHTTYGALTIERALAHTSDVHPALRHLEPRCVIDVRPNGKIVQRVVAPSPARRVQHGATV